MKKLILRQAAFFFVMLVRRLQKSFVRAAVSTSSLSEAPVDKTDP